MRRGSFSAAQGGRAQRGVMMLRPAFIAMLLGVVPFAAATAQDVIGLSPEAREAVLQAAATRDESLPINGAPDGQIHGEMGVMVGSDGSRAVYGSTVIPLGTTASLALAYSDGSYGRRRYRHR